MLFVQAVHDNFDFDVHHLQNVFNFVSGPNALIHSSDYHYPIKNSQPAKFDISHNGGRIPLLLNAI